MHRIVGGGGGLHGGFCSDKLNLSIRVYQAAIRGYSVILCVLKLVLIGRWALGVRV